MPVDKKVKERHQLLDELFRTPEGLTYHQLQKALAEQGLVVTIRTLQHDIAFFESNYNAVFKKDLRQGHSLLVRYADITQSVLDKSDIADRLLDVSREIQLNNDLYPHFVLASSIIQHLANGNSVDTFYKAVDFGSNQYLTGIELFGDILRAIVNKQCISFTYRPYFKAPIGITVSPYQLKQYNQRWILICKTVGAQFYSFDALDRIVGEISVSDAKYENPDWERLSGLDATIGTTDALNSKLLPEKVVLKVSQERYPFIESKPLHTSQEHVESTEDAEIIQLYVKVNRELESNILYFGKDIEVLNPLSLRERIRRIITELSDKYNKTTK